MTLSTWERARAQARAVKQATRAHEIALAELAEGLTGRLEVTDAEVALRRSEVNYAEAVHEYLRARAEPRPEDRASPGGRRQVTPFGPAHSIQGVIEQERRAR